MKYRYPYHNKHSYRISILTRNLRPYRGFLNAVVLTHAGQDGAQRFVRLLCCGTELCVFLAVRIFNILRLREHWPNNGRGADH